MKGGDWVRYALLSLCICLEGSGWRVLASSIGEVVSLDTGLDIDSAIQESSPLHAGPFGYDFAAATDVIGTGGLESDGIAPSIEYAALSHRIVSTDGLIFDDVTLDAESTGQFVIGHAKLRNGSSYPENANVTAPYAECGNGVRDRNEQCDDGNIVDGDGCSGACKVEGGWACESPSLSMQGKCRPCKETECTMSYNQAFRCLSTQGRGEANKFESAYRRSSNGFCGCAETHCQRGVLCLKPHRGTFRDAETGKCGCGPGYCLQPMSKGPNSGALKLACVKLTDEYEKNNVTDICDCARARAAVSSNDPAVARKATNDSCRIYPTQSIQEAGQGESKFPAYQCEHSPYKFTGAAATPMQSRICDSCVDSGCSLKRNIGNGGAGAIECLSDEQMSIEGMSRGAGGQCECDADSCLVPERDSYRCKRLNKAFPYGAVKTSEGKCGCAEDQNTCIMKTNLTSSNSANFLCLDLGTNLVRTDYGKKFRRGDNGECQCLATSCRSDPNTESVGIFDCVDVQKNMAFARSTDPAAEGACECRKGSCAFSGDSGGTPMCTICPKSPGTCKSRCTEGGDTWGTRTECVKYCSTKHVKIQPPPMSDGLLPPPPMKMLGRVVECFIKKNVTCLKNSTASAWTCEQTVNANLLQNCPARWSPHANRDLPDGTSTKGYKSICDIDDLVCLLQKCDRRGSAGVCLEKMITI